ncbi:MAG: YeiH family protein [Firmicutes bacterium]|nr:YeiH family protein [Bacillota bacterium]MBU4532762.1 YeiH family protein [Bacillota bacterium]MBU4554577.1 YeiH family protein [Bacillota bacterium]MBV1727700.1 YeiH family protein [Desulforudis sp.]MBV1736245.1 YeiH family protein [Desulforudis sp.]
MDDKFKNQPTQSDDIVVDKPKSSWSDLWKFEDYWAIWLGILLLVAGMFIFFNNPPAEMNEKITKANATMQAEAERAPFKTIAYVEADEVKGKLKASDGDLAKTLANYLSRPKGWDSNPVPSFYLSEADAAAKSAAEAPKYEAAQEKTIAVRAAAEEAEAAAAAAGFQNTQLNKEADTAIDAWVAAKAAESKAKSGANVKPYNLIPTLIVLCVAFALFFAIGTRFMGRDVAGFLMGFPFVFLVAIIAYMMSNQGTMKAYGIEYVIWAIGLGLLISNTVGTPRWVMPAVQTEYYIKTGLVLLGASILFSKILLIGQAGIFVTWVVTPIVLICTFWFGQKVLKMESKTLNITVSADMSVSGVSAAIATAAACRAKKEELTLAVGISVAFTAVMMILMPAFIKSVGMHHVLGGAWMGGTIDSTGAVVAAGAILSDTAMYVAATIKMIQNVMIGVIAFGVAAYWCTKVECTPGAKLGFKDAMYEIWARFPKFVLGFIGASVVFSIIYSSMGDDVGKVLVDEGVIKGWTSGLQGWFFALAFASIGLATNFRELAKYFKGGKVVILYVCGQSFNLILTLLMAYLMFFVVFPGVTEKLMGG